jgi:lipopolysaccharide transport system permease protein
MLGPWLSAIALAALLVGTAIAVSVLAGSSFREQLPVVAISLALWMFVSNSVVEAAELYEVERGLLLNSRISPLTLVYRLIWRNFLIGIHSLPVVVVACGIERSQLTVRAILFPAGLAVMAVMISGPVLVVARVCLHRRDVARVIPALMQVLFFVTPILWVPPTSGPGRLFAEANPLAWPINVSKRFIEKGNVESVHLIKIAVWCVFSIVMLEVASRTSDRDRLRV